MPSYAYTMLKEGLIHAWIPSMGATGYALLDRSGRAKHGTLSNMDAGTDWVASGGGNRVGYALDLNGSNNSVSLPRGLGMVGSFQMAISYWVFLRGFTSDARHLHQWGASNPDLGWLITSTSGNNARITTATTNLTGSYRIFSTSADCLSLNAWQHVVANFNNTSGVYEVWVNGVSYAGTYPLADNTAAIQDSSTTPTIGGGGGGGFVNGLMDDIRIYNRTLSRPIIALLGTRRGVGLEQDTGKVYSFVPAAVGVTGSLSATLGSVSVASSATVSAGASGSVTATLGSVSVASSATVSAGASGSVTATLGSLVVTSAGTVVSGATGNLTATLVAVTSSASGTVANGLSGSLAATLGSLSSSSSGTLANGLTATLTRTLDNATLAATGSETSSPSGAVSSTLGQLTCSSSGTLASGLTGSVARTLASLTASSSGTIGAASTGSVNRTLGSLSLASGGSLSAGLTAQVNRALESCVVSSTGTVANGTTGVLSVQLASVSLVARGGEVLPGGFRLKVAGEWKDATAFIKVGDWKQATPYTKVGGVWK